MKWTKYTLHTINEATDIISYTLSEIGVEGIEIEDNVPLTEDEKRQMYVDILPDPVACDNKAVIRFYRDTDEDSEAFLKKLNDELDKIKEQLPERTARVSSALRNSVFNVMAGGGVSAPGQPPGVRTGNYRNSFVSSTESNGMSFTAKVTSDCLYGPFLEDGTSKMAARPHCDRIAEDALPQAIAIYSELY